MKFNDFLDSATPHETFVFLAQNQGLSGLDPPKHQKHAKITNFSKITKISPFSAKIIGKPEKSPKIRKKESLQSIDFSREKISEKKLEKGPLQIKPDLAGERKAHFGI